MEKHQLNVIDNVLADKQIYKNFFQGIKKLFDEHSLELNIHDLHVFVYLLGICLYQLWFNNSEFDANLHTIEYFREVQLVTNKLHKNYQNKHQLFPFIKCGQKYNPIIAKNWSNDEDTVLNISDNQNLIIFISPYTEGGSRKDYLSELRYRLKKKKVNAKLINLAIGNKSKIVEIAKDNEVDYYIDIDSDYSKYVESMYDMQFDPLGRHLLIVNLCGEVIMNRGRISIGEESNTDAIHACLCANQDYFSKPDYFMFRQKVDTYFYLGPSDDVNKPIDKEIGSLIFSLNKDNNNLNVKYSF